MVNIERYPFTPGNNPDTLSETALNIAVNELLRHGVRQGDTVVVNSYLLNLTSGFVYQDNKRIGQASSQDIARLKRRR